MTTRWGVFEDDNEVHVVPMMDVARHNLDGPCWCGETWEKPEDCVRWVVTHNQGLIVIPDKAKD